MDLAIYHQVAQGEPAELPLPDRALFRLTGSDRIRYLNGQITQDVSKLKTGNSTYGALLTGKGKMVSDLFVSASEESLWLDTPGELRTVAQQRIIKFLIADDAELEDVTDRFTLSHAFGPIPSGSTMAFLNPRFGLSGYDVWQELDPSTRITPSPLAAEVVEAFRIESAIGKWGKELDENTLPQEALFERHGLSYEKGCYVGQETVARIRSLGHVNRKLALLEFMEGNPADLPDKIFADEIEVGKVTSVSYSPLLQKMVGLGMVSRKFNLVGQELRCETGRLKIVEPPRKIS